MLQIAFARSDFRIGLIGFGLLVGLAILLPLVSSIDPVKIAYSSKLLPPFPAEGWKWPYLLGTDQLGRDVLMRCLVGLRYSLLIGVTTVVLMFIVGCSLGLYAGFRGGWADAVIMRLTDAQLSIPMIILAITILGVSRPTVPAIILVLGLSGWPLYARVARSVALGERNRGYVLGERVLGASDLRIMLLFVAPVVLPPIAFVAVLDIARMMIFESILGFLGLGVQPPTPTFGNVIADARKYLLNAWWIATMPGLFMLVSLTCLNLMGSALERARNAVLRGEA
ncbi:ABC transporter permease [Metarhizobium album]|uniref:ABC transporter permease n=2 Tax=Metarhizobium album TaxID=2182425 RepID=A0A2U2DJY6_9HYPH|nr:ABC transporter permease [Rhizobium album]